MNLTFRGEIVPGDIDLEKSNWHMGDVEIHKIGWAHVKDSREVKRFFKKKGIEKNIEKNSKIESQEKFMSWKPSEEIA